MVILDTNSDQLYADTNSYRSRDTNSYHFRNHFRYPLLAEDHDIPLQIPQVFQH